MKNTHILKKAVALLLALLLLALPLSLSSCHQKKLGEPLLALGEHTFTENMFELLLSRVKGNLARSGYDVTGSTLWDTVITSDGTVYDQYIRQLTLQDAKEYLVAARLFDELGMVFTKSDEEKIQKDIQEMIDQRADGSNASFNQLLSAYGANIDILRALYVLEAKYAAVRIQLYGAEGEKIADNVLQEYLENHAVCFRQLLIRSYTYVYETDANGDDIYYLPAENNGKVSNIAYDRVNGSPRVDEFGKTVVDKNGDTVSYTENGRIAYDTEHGVRAYAYDSNGQPKTKPYTAEKLTAHKAEAEELLTRAIAAGPAGFEALLAEYELSEDEAYLADSDYCFLYTTQDNGNDYLNDMADVLSDMKDGEARQMSSEYGEHVFMRYHMPSDAATNDDYATWFPDLVSRVADQLFAVKCEPYMKEVVVDNQRFAALPSMKEIGINYYY